MSNVRNLTDLRRAIEVREAYVEGKIEGLREAREIYEASGFHGFNPLAPEHGTYFRGGPL